MSSGTCRKQSTLKKQHQQGNAIASNPYDEINLDMEEVYDEINEQKVGYSLPKVENSEQLPDISYQPLRSSDELTNEKENANQSTSEPDHVDLPVIDDDKNAEHTYLVLLDDDKAAGYD